MDSRKTVLANGCFDPFHFGHLCHFQEARKMGDSLVVAVTRDASVGKGENRPVFKEDERAAVIRALAIVDKVILVGDPIEAFTIARPSVWALGTEYKFRVKHDHRRWCEENACQIIFTTGPVYSSTTLLLDLSRSS